jgi:hypothetical protein
MAADETVQGLMMTVQGLLTMITRRALATSEDRESLIRQRCGGQKISSLAEVCSAPVSRDCIEDVHSFGRTKATCTQQ